MLLIAALLFKQLMMLLEILELTEACDATKYMIAAGITLKSLYPKLFHVTCCTIVL